MKSKNTYQFSIDDMISFTNWYHNEFLNDIIGLNGVDKEKSLSHLKNKGVTEEVINIWKECGIKIKLTMAQKLIKLSETHYVVIDDSEIKINDWVYSMDGIHQWFGLVLKTEPSPKKITHSTQPLEDYGNKELNDSVKTWLVIKPLSLSEVEELINGYSVEKMADEKYPYKLSSGARRAGFVDGFKAHQELTKDKLFTTSFIINLVPKVLEKQGELNTSDFNDWYNSDFLRILFQKTEWDIKFNEQGKLELI
jgi:hypothetical protein